MRHKVCWFLLAAIPLGGLTVDLGRLVYASCANAECVRASCKINGWHPNGVSCTCTEYNFTTGLCLKHNTADGTGTRKVDPEVAVSTRTSICFHGKYCRTPPAGQLGDLCQSNDNFEDTGTKKYQCCDGAENCTACS
jgi:hypothetical protein